VGFLKKGGAKVGCTLHAPCKHAYVHEHSTCMLDIIQCVHTDARSTQSSTAAVYMCVARRMTLLSIVCLMTQQSLCIGDRLRHQ